MLVAAPARPYAIVSPYWLVQDNPGANIYVPDSTGRAALIDTRRDFHIATGDYFMNLATILSFAEENLHECGDTDITSHLLEAARKDLIHLQNHYTLSRRTDPKVLQ